MVPDARGHSMSITDDPLTLALQPPENETKEERIERLKEEAEAKRISDAIDDDLKADARKKKKTQGVSVLLLGQSESGKSSLAKQFQIMYTPNAFREELASWRAVIYLNVVRSVLHLVDAITLDPHLASDQANSEEEGYQTTFDIPARFLDLVERLHPLYGLERALINLLAGTDGGEASHTADGLAGRKEYSVRAGTWRTALARLRGGSSGRPSMDARPESPELSEPMTVLASRKADIVQLWTDPAVQDILTQRRLVLQHGSGFFLDDIDRIVDSKYTPTPQDVLNARLKTVGVIEHVFSFNSGPEKNTDWKIYDVGGARNQRATWIPYFDFVDAIIFLAPISAFDQVLTEDPEVNRVEDSVLLFRTICSSKLLANTNIILFLNKCDILKEKLKAGVQVNKYILSYKAANDFESVTKYFRSKFAFVHQNSSKSSRDFYVHLTSMTNMHTMATIILDVRDVILRKNLTTSNLM